MSDNISQKIDIYTKKNISELRKKEVQSGKKLTKYDIALQMYYSGALSETELQTWLGSQEGAMSGGISKSGGLFNQNRSIFNVMGNNNSDSEPYLDKFLSSNKPPVKEPVRKFKAPFFNKKTEITNSSSLNDEKIRNNTIDLLLQNAKSAQLMLNNYHNNIGYISSDAFVQGMNVIGDKIWDGLTGRNDFVTVFENEDAIKNEINLLERLKTKTSNPAEFNKLFKEYYGIDFNPKNFEKLVKVSNSLNEYNIYSGLSKSFDYAIKEIEKGTPSAVELCVYLSPLFGNNTFKSKAYVDEVAKECKTESELREKLASILKEAKKENDKKIQGINREKLESEYTSAYKLAMGDYKSDEIISNYIHTSQMNAMLSETALVILLQSWVQKLVRRFLKQE